MPGISIHWARGQGGQCGWRSGGGRGGATACVASVFGVQPSGCFFSREDRLKPVLRTRGGFTLIELLVVVAIVAILIAMLVPSFVRARDRVRETYCMANEKQIGHALYYYANDNSGYCVPRGISRSNGSGWAGPVGYPLMSDGFTQDAYWSDQILLGQYAGNTTGDATPMIYVYGTVCRRSPFVCPSDKTNPYIDANTAHLSYGMGPNFPTIIPPGTVGASPPYANMWKLAAAERPAQEMVVVDALGERFSPGAVIDPFPFPGSAEPLENFSWNEGAPNSKYGWAKRHAGGANVLFVDGHVDYFADLKTGYDRGEICCHRVE
jgi:prepilin-type N-terminal cleavage/methylation domain-containing protein/prepilin-type processing-associated H-X9-DG protein